MSQTSAVVARRWFEEVWNRREIDKIDELSTPDSIGHLESGDATLDDFRRFHVEFLAAFPDLSIEIEEIVADGENVVVRWMVRGCHRGRAFGMDASDCQVAKRGMTWMKVRDGRIVEAWDCWNQAALFQQMRGATA